jgi:hypothetical protein
LAAWFSRTLLWKASFYNYEGKNTRLREHGGNLI